ncbi:MAG: C40 family peptidase, partial [Gaiellales bacterium]
MSERGQVAPVLAGITLLLLWGGLFLFFLGRVDAGGARAQTAADLAALAAAQRLAADPAAGAPALRAEAARVARANGGRLVSLVTLTDHGLPSGVEVGVAVRVEGAVPGVGRQAHDLVQRSRAAVSFSASLPAGTFRPIDLHGLTGRSAVVAAAAAQIGWPYIWGGESRAEGGFDCSGLIDFAYAAAGRALPGRPTAAGLWRMARPVSPDELRPGDLVFRGAESRAPYHVGMYAGQGAVIVAPHSGAQVRFEPVAAGGWDGFGRLLEGPATAAGDPAVDAAARRNGVPPFVVQAEMRLGLAGDPEAAAVALARAQARHPDDLESALAEALGSRSAAALVLREGAGTELGEGFQGRARLVAVPSDGDSNGAAGAAPAGASPERSGRVGRGDLVASAVRVAEIAAHQLAGHGSRARLQALAGLRNASRFALTGAALLLPDPGWREAASFVGSAWDAASAASQALET